MHLLTGECRHALEEPYEGVVPEDVRMEAGVYAPRAAGRLVQRGNIFTGSGRCETNGTVTEPRAFYSYTLDPASDVSSLVRAGAGVGKTGG